MAIAMIADERDLLKYLDDSSLSSKDLCACIDALETLHVFEAIPRLQALVADSAHAACVRNRARKAVKNLGGSIDPPAASEQALRRQAANRRGNASKRSPRDYNELIRRKTLKLLRQRGEAVALSDIYDSIIKLSSCSGSDRVALKARIRRVVPTIQGVDRIQRGHYVLKATASKR